MVLAEEQSELRYNYLVKSSPCNDFIEKITVNDKIVFDRENTDFDLSNSSWINVAGVIDIKIPEDRTFNYIIDFNENLNTLERAFGVSIYGTYNFDFSHLDTSKVTTMSALFQSGNIETIKFGGKFSTSLCKDFGSMFSMCRILKDLDISCFEINEGVTNTNSMFGDCNNLENINFGKNIWYDVTFSRMFTNCTSLKYLDLSTLNYIDKSSPNASGTFDGCTSLTHIKFGKNIPDWSTFVANYNTGWKCFNGLPENGIIEYPSESAEIFNARLFVDKINTRPILNWEKIAY